MRHFLIFILCISLLGAPVYGQVNRKGCPKVALVLGGGGAKGAAEVGVLKCLQQQNVPIDLVVGTSIGSIVGGLYCAGIDVNTLDKLFRSQEWIDLFTDRNSSFKGDIYKEQDGVSYVFGFPIKRNPNANGNVKNTVGVLKGDSITSLFGRISGYSEPMNFDDLPVPFRCIAVDVKTMEEVVFGKGSLPHAMRASMAIPGVFKPLRMGDRMLIDGGALNNLPVDVARSLGADIVIAVDLSQDADLKNEPKSNWLTDTFGGMDLGGHLNWLIRRPDNQKYRKNLKEADLIITPDLHEYDVASFTAKAISVMIDRGEAAAKKVEKQIADLSQKARLPKSTNE